MEVGEHDGVDGSQASAGTDGKWKSLPSGCHFSAIAVTSASPTWIVTEGIRG